MTLAVPRAWRVRASAALAVLALLALLALLGACRDAAEPDGGTGTAPARVDDPAPPTARLDLVQAFRADLAAPRHPSDGGGRAWIEAGPETVEAGSTARWTIAYEAGPLGVAPGGALFLQVSPFWGWSTPQVTAPERLGYTTVETDAAGVELTPSTIDRQLLHVAVSGRGLHVGEVVRFVYGAGAAGARVDDHADRGSPLWIAVDGDGDGVRALVADPPRVDVKAGPPARLLVTLPSTARPGAEVVLRVALLDAGGSAWRPAAARVELALETEPGSDPTELALPEALELAPADEGLGRVTLRAGGPGVYRISARAVLADLDAPPLTGESNPLRVDARRPRILWGDLHGHSGRSDGTGTPDDWYRYAREVAGLDVAALTDHDHYGIRALDVHRETWAEILAVAERRHETGRFVTLPGYEWTSWIHGHRHVLYFASEGPLWSSLDEATDTPRELWERLADLPAITVPHHPAGGPIPVDWSWAPDPRQEPAVEVASAHGSSEAADSPSLLYAFRAEHSVRSVLDRGRRYGFVASGDGHDGHPGATHLAPQYGFRRGRGALGDRMGNGGVVAIRAEELTRAAVLAALRGRRTYATSGPRILLDVALGPHAMGAAVPAAELGERVELAVEALGTAPVERAVLVRGGPGRGAAGTEVELLALEPVAGDPRHVTATAALRDLRPGEYVYVRVEQADAGLAWSSPIYVD